MNPMYALLSIGVNRTPNTPLLEHAERDALRFGLAVTSAKGAIPPANATYMRSSTTQGDLDRALQHLARVRPMFLMIFFGGHGDAAGIGLADGIYPYVRLKRWLAAIGAHATIVVLDCCQAAGMFKSGADLGSLPESLDPAWAARLLATEPGVRVFAAADWNQSTYESPRSGGWFVSALIKAMFDRRGGDLVDDNGVELVSARRVFQRAKAIMESLDVTPVSHGRIDDFPLMLSNASPCGHVAMKIRQAANLGIVVEATVRDRRHLSTRIVATPMDAFRNVLPSEQDAFYPLGDVYVRQARFHVDVDVSPGCQQELWQHGVCRVSWDVGAFDAEGRLVGHRRVLAEYGTGRPSAYW